MVSYLFASPDEVFEEGRYVNFNFTATNIGEMEGSYDIEFKVYGETISRAAHYEGVQGQEEPRGVLPIFFRTKSRRSQFGDDN